MEYGNDADQKSEHKSIGGALVDVFDAGVTLVKSEVSSLVRRLSKVAKAKALGVVLLLAALVPLTLALIFLILFAFYGLMRLGLGAWAAALIIALVSLVVAGALLFIGLQRLGAEVSEDEGADAGKGGHKDHDRKDHDRKDQGSHKDHDDHKDQGQQGSQPARAGMTAERVTVPGDRRDETTLVTATGGRGAASVQRGGSQQAGNQQGGDPSTPAPAVVGTATQGTAAPAGHKPAEPDGVEVSTTPTFRDDMKKEGY